MLRLLERLHDSQLDLGPPAGGRVQPDGSREQRRARKKEEGVPRVPEAVIPGAHEEEHHGLDGDQHQAHHGAARDPAIRTATAAVRGGGDRDHEEGRRLKHHVEIGEPAIDDQWRKDKREGGHGCDAQAGDSARRRDSAPEGSSWIRKRTGALQQQPREHTGHADMT